VRIALVREPMRYDEAFTFLAYATRPVGFITSTYALLNNHILYSLAVHAVWQVFGYHVWTVRLPALLARSGLVPVAYMAACRLYGRPAALWAGSLVAGLAPLVFLSVNGRGYMPGILLVVGALWLAAGLLEARRAPFWRWALYSLCCALAVYTVPTMAYGVATVTAWAVAVAVVRRDAPTGARFAFAIAAAAGLDAILYSAVLGQRGWHAIGALGSGRPAAGALGSAGDLVRATWESWNRGAPHPLVWLIAAGFIASLLVHRRLARHPVPLAAPAAAVALGAYAVGAAAPFARSWSYLVPVYAIHAGSGLSWAAGRVTRRGRRAERVALALPAILAVTLAVATADAGELGTLGAPQSDDDIVGLLKRELRPGEAVLLGRFRVAVPSSYYFRRFAYHPRSLPRAHSPTRALVIVPRGGGQTTVRDAAQEVGWRLLEPPEPRLIRRLDYVEAWEARLQ